MQAGALFSGNKVFGVRVTFLGAFWCALGEALGSLLGWDTWVRSWGPGCPKEGSGGHFRSLEATFAVDLDEI